MGRGRALEDPGQHSFCQLLSCPGVVRPRPTALSGNMDRQVQTVNAQGTEALGSSDCTGLCVHRAYTVSTLYSTPCLHCVCTVSTPYLHRALHRTYTVL